MRLTKLGAGFGIEAGSVDLSSLHGNDFRKLESELFKHQVLVIRGQKLTAKFGPHPPRGTATDHFWSVSWIIPESYPTGSLTYKVVATDLQGQSQSWEPFKREPTQLTVIAGEIEIKK